MNIFEIVDREDPVDEFEAEEQEDENTDGDVSPVKKAFRSALNKYKQLAKKNTKNPVASTWIADLDYDHAAKECTMRLSDGKNYRIQGMQPDVYYSWVKAPSKGKFFHQHIKDNYYV